MLITMAGLAFSALLNGLYYIPIILRYLIKKKISTRIYIGKRWFGKFSFDFINSWKYIFGIFPLPIIKLIEIGI